jgi:hypothetical protein
MTQYIKPCGATHHNSVRPDVEPPVFVLQEGQDAEYEALKLVWEHNDSDPDATTAELVPPTREQFDQLKREGVLALPLVPKNPEDLPIDNPQVRMVLWYETKDANGQPLDEPNIGFGYSTDGTLDGTHKLCNTWVKAWPYKPPTKRRAQLEAMSKEGLIDLVLILEEQ